MCRFGLFGLMGVVVGMLLAVVLVVIAKLVYYLKGLWVRSWVLVMRELITFGGFNGMLMVHWVKVENACGGVFVIYENCGLMVYISEVVGCFVVNGFFVLVFDLLLEEGGIGAFLDEVAVVVVLLQILLVRFD